MSDVDKKLSLLESSAFGLQHVLVLFFSSISVPLIVGNAIGMSMADVAYLINASLLCAGVATLVQSLGIGKNIGLKLPVMQGVTLMAVSALTAIATEYDIQTVLGSVIVAGIVCILIGPIFSKLMRFFPNIVRGTVIAVVGLTLIPVAVNWVAGSGDNFGQPTNFLLTFIVLLVIVLLNKFSTGFIKNIAPLIALITGFLAALAMNRVDLSPVTEASWFGMSLPFHFGMPKFVLSPIISLSLIMIVIMAETVVIYLAIGEISGESVGEKEMRKGFLANGINVIFSGIFNSFLFTSFTQNIGLVSLTKVKSRYTTAAGGVILILLGFFPKLATIVATIPSPVLGGVGIVVFSSIIASGIRIIMDSGLEKQNNQLIVSISFGIGLVTQLLKNAGAYASFPSYIRMFLEDGVIMGCIAAILLNIIFSEAAKEKLE